MRVLVTVMFVACGGLGRDGVLAPIGTVAAHGGAAR